LPGFASRQGGQRKLQRHGSVGPGGGADQFPSGGAGETMRRFARPAAKPGEANGDAAANRLAGREPTFATEEEQRRFAVFLKVREVCALGINFRVAGGGSDHDPGQTAAAGDDGDAPGKLVL